MHERNPRRIRFDDFLSLLVQIGTFGLIRFFLGIDQDGMQLFIYIEAAVVAWNSILVEERVKEVIRVAIITSPAEHVDIIFFASFGVIKVSRPFRGLNDGFNTDFLPVGLNGFRNLFAVRHVRTGYRHCIQCYSIRQTVRVSGFSKKCLRFIQIVFIILHSIVIAPQ
ncbi:hypothetical protein D3C75_965880 [compost metagenome]